MLGERADPLLFFFIHFLFEGTSPLAEEVLDTAPFGALHWLFPNLHQGQGVAISLLPAPACEQTSWF